MIDMRIIRERGGGRNRRRALDIET